MTKVGFPGYEPLFFVGDKFCPGGSYLIANNRKDKMTKSVPQALTDLGDLYRERNKIYGDNYKNFGRVMRGLFPEGIKLKTEDDFNRFGVFLQIVSKVSRYAPCFEGKGHADSLDDITVYSQMLRELDGLMADERLKGTF